MDIYCKDHMTTERFWLMVDEEPHYMEIDRYDPSIVGVEKAITNVRVRYYKIVDDKLIPFDNELFIQKSMEYLQVFQQRSILNNVGGKLPFWYTLKIRFPFLWGKK